VIRGETKTANLAAAGPLLRFELMEKIVKDGTAEIISLSRPFLRQPNLVKLFNSE
jgi:2,4-dienoyl-CoA reductase-like NADH-dependent reductase (Old Yellow Enzyme family)